MQNSFLLRNVTCSLVYLEFFTVTLYTQLPHDVSVISLSLLGNHRPWAIGKFGPLRASESPSRNYSVHPYYIARRLRLIFVKTWSCPSLPLSLWKLLRKNLALYPNSCQLEWALAKHSRPIISPIKPSERSAFSAQGVGTYIDYINSLPKKKKNLFLFQQSIRWSHHHFGHLLLRRSSTHDVVSNASGK